MGCLIGLLSPDKIELNCETPSWDLTMAWRGGKTMLPTLELVPEHSILFSIPTHSADGMFSLDCLMGTFSLPRTMLSTRPEHFRDESTGLGYLDMLSF